MKNTDARWPSWSTTRLGMLVGTLLVVQGISSASITLPVSWSSGQTLTAADLTAQFSAINQAMVDRTTDQTIAGKKTFNGQVTTTMPLGIGADPTQNARVQVAAFNGTSLRVEGGTSANLMKAISVGGFGRIEVDAPGTVGGRLLLEDNGILNTPQQSSVLAHRATNITIPNATPTTIVFSSISQNTQNEYDGTTGQFTAKSTGTYLLCASMLLPYANSSFGVYQGTQLISSFGIGSGLMQGCRPLTLFATNTVEVKAVQNSGSSQTFAPDNTVIWLTVNKIR